MRLTRPTLRSVPWRLLAFGAIGMAVVGVVAAGPEPPPGLEAPRSAELVARLEAAVEGLGPGYTARTEHLRADGSPRFTNRLIFEGSPYLRQHAHNPIEWYPWGEEAFARARAEQKPVFLSVGYSTCHWCHVMERESFDDLEVAARLNRDFVCIKVDREQRPDLDEVYMTAVQLLRRSGGWPMTLILTPEAKPFFAGTYLPKAQLLDLLGRITDAWANDRERVLAAADELNEAVVAAVEHRREAREVGDDVPSTAVEQLLRAADRVLGGFGGAPKFPHETSLLLLLEQVRRSAERRDEILAVVEQTLTAMSRGGLFDQVGGGFHRYSTDARWRVPHFEKMLYNQALLARVYASAASLLGNPELERTARQTLGFALREMRSGDGLFYSALDADSLGADGEAEEGAYYLWTPAEIRAALEPADAALALELFGVTADGEVDGANVLVRTEPVERWAAERGVGVDAALAQIERVRERLRTVRSRRSPPLRDEKILTGWNGLMITALAEAATRLGDAELLVAAEETASRLWSSAVRAESGRGRLWRSRLGGVSSGEGLLEDSAYFAAGLLALDEALRAAGAAEATIWLERAAELADGMIEQFWKPNGGGFFAGHDVERSLLPARPGSASDGAIPSAPGVAVAVLAELSRRTGETAYRRRAEEAVASVSGALVAQPAAFATSVRALELLRRGAAGPSEYGAGGVVRAQAAAERQAESAAFSVRLSVRDGWHINANRPRHEDLVPTRVDLAPAESDWAVDGVVYPQPELLALSVREGELALYRGEVRVRGRIVRADGERTSGRILAQEWAERAVAPRPARLPNPTVLVVQVQACNDTVCLQPEQLELEVDLP